jgi:anhydro-N-acetylmuramic acid kinase
MLLNHLSRKQDSPYDTGGATARKGRLDEQLFQQLNGLSYYTLPFPKSTGYEWFSSQVLPLVENSELGVPDLLNTAVHHIAEQIAIQLRLHTNGERSSVLVTGGGAFNVYLIEVMQEKLGPDFKLVIPSEQLVSFKEAMVFAFMGLLRMEHQTNVLSSVTGARSDSCSGVVFLP